MKKIHAFILGVLEFRSDFTTHFSSWDAMCSYNWGRELAHRITFRRFEL